MYFTEHWASTVAARQKGSKARDMKLMNQVTNFWPNSELLKFTVRLISVLFPGSQGVYDFPPMCPMLCVNVCMES